MDALEKEVKAELEDSRFDNRRHGTRACYRAGCRGPLCKREVRRIRRRYREPAGEPYQGALDKMLEPFQEEHNRDFFSREKASA